MVTNEIVSAVGADTFVFVYSAATQAFSHYAVAADMELPTSYELAQVTGAKFYRLAKLTRTWDTVNGMTVDLSDTMRRVQSLADELNALVGPLTIDRTTTIIGG